MAVGTDAARKLWPKATVVGNPVRAELFAIAPLDGRSSDRKLRILVVGGSQGARILNRVIPDALGLVLARGLAFEALHQSGKAREGVIDPEALRARYAGLGDRCTVKEFLHDVPAELAAADLVVARAGAMTTAELAAAGRPSLLVPFAAATHGHQLANARALERAGAAVVLTEDEATPERVAEALAALLSDPARLAAMGRAARAASRPDAAEKFADLVMAVERA